MKKLFLVAVLAIGAGHVPALGTVLAASDNAEQITLSTHENYIEFESNGWGIPNQGWYALGSGNNTNNIASYTASRFRSFYSFLVPPQPPGRRFISAAFVALLGGTSSSNEQMETVGFYDVSTDAVTLNHNVEKNALIYDDLGTGSSYGEFVIPGRADRMTLLQLPLNGKAVSDINAAAGNYFSIGAGLLSSNGGDYIFGNDNNAKLQLTLVPEPSTASLLAIGLVALARRRYAT